MTIDPDRYERFPSLLPVKEEVLRHLTAAVKEKDSAFREASVASQGHDGHPQVRIMIARDFESEAMVLTFFTDARSPKVAGLQKDSVVQVLMYDPSIKTQLRISGEVEIHEDDALADQLWSNLPEYGRGDYLSRQPPGEQIAHPGDSWEDKTLGSQNFMALRVHIRAVDWLKLSSQGHRRALLTWDDGKYSARWLTP